MKHLFITGSKIAGVFFGCISSFFVIAQPSQKDIKELNGSIIFDLFTNYEIAEKNRNLAVLVDFVPLEDNADFASVTVDSDAGYEDQKCVFSYNKQQDLTKFTYQIDDRFYQYDYMYKANRVDGVSIAGKRKISVNYDESGRVSQIIRAKGQGIDFEYNLEYEPDGRRANIKLVVREGNRQSSPRKYYITWNDDYQLTSYALDVYTAKDITYNEDGSLNSYSFYKSDEVATATWTYTSYDDKGYWSNKEYKDVHLKRSFVYQK